MWRSDQKLFNAQTCTITSFYRLFFLLLHHFSSIHHDPPSTLVGTYNNQYMVLDRSKVKLGHSVDDGALTVVEQIPGLVEYSDQTQALRRGNSRSFFFLFSTVLVWTFEELIFPAACVYHRLLALLQCSLPQEDLHPEWLWPNVGEVWRGIFL